MESNWDISYIYISGWWFGTFGLFFLLLGISSSGVGEKPPTSGFDVHVNGDFIAHVFWGENDDNHMSKHHVDNYVIILSRITCNHTMYDYFTSWPFH